MSKIFKTIANALTANHNNPGIAYEHKPLISESNPSPFVYKPPFMYLGAPTKIGDTTQAYRYAIKVASPFHEILKDGFDSGEYNFSVDQIDGEYWLTLCGKPAGKLIEKTEMIGDWLHRGDPYRIYLRDYTYEQDCNLILVFYKDKSAPHKWREQTVVPLMSYRGKALQEVSSYLYPKEEVTLEENAYQFDCIQSEEDVAVCYKGELIGKLPAKYASKVISSGATFAEIEEIVDSKDSNGNDFSRPVIRIYW